MSVSSSSDNDPPVPFLVQLVYRTGTFYRYALSAYAQSPGRVLTEPPCSRPEEFASLPLPPHISVYTWPHCTLSELALELAAARPSALPYPAVGTRLVFQLVYPDLRGGGAGSDAVPRFAVKDLGSIVLGRGLPGAETSEPGHGGAVRPDQEVGRTLSDARFVVGDYLSCAVLPPLSDGSVAPASNARHHALMPREARAYHGVAAGRDDYSNRGAIRGGKGRGGRGDGFGARLPMGDWRRGESLPESPPTRPSRGAHW